MIMGLAGGLLWALDTVLLGLILSMGPFTGTAHALMIAPLVATFIHDFFSALYTGSTILMRKQGRSFVGLFRKKGILLIVIAGLLGGPVGMTGYVSSIRYLGAGPTAVFSSLFPALGCVLSLFFLGEKMKGFQMGGLAVSLVAVAFLSVSDMAMGENLLIGFLFASLCVLGWASEAVLIKKALETTEASENEVLFIRQTVSSLTYLLLILPLMKGTDVALDAVSSPVLFWTAVTSLFGTLSYFCYYRAITRVGAGKAMSLNITYTAWAVMMSAAITGRIPAVWEAVLSILVVLGSLVAANSFNIGAKEKPAA